MGCCMVTCICPWSDLSSCTMLTHGVIISIITSVVFASPCNNMPCAIHPSYYLRFFQRDMFSN